MPILSVVLWTPIVGLLAILLVAKDKAARSFELAALRNACHAGSGAGDWVEMCAVSAPAQRAAATKARPDRIGNRYPISR